MWGRSASVGEEMVCVVRCLRGRRSERREYALRVEGAELYDEVFME